MKRLFSRRYREGVNVVLLGTLRRNTLASSLKKAGFAEAPVSGLLINPVPMYSHHVLVQESRSRDPLNRNEIA